MHLTTEYVIADIDLIKPGERGEEIPFLQLGVEKFGRDLVALCGDQPFFSMDDWFIGSTAMPAGIPNSARTLTLTFQYNDLATVETLFHRYPSQIACVVLEPAAVHEPAPGFLEHLRRLCDAKGTVLIFDENITGFRWLQDPRGLFQLIAGPSVQLPPSLRGPSVALLSLVMMDMMSKTMIMRIVILAAGAGGGYVLPGFMLERKIKKRQETLRLSLPDALDLMVVSVEAGLGLDQAIQHVSRELQPTHPEISEEWGLVTLEMRAGKRRSDALRNLADRTGEPELRKLVAILVQNDRFGTSMAESLRAHSDFMRTRRRQDAEERAGKVGVKLIFPIFFFILPSMMVVTAGPALLQVFKYLFPLMANAVK